MRRIALYGTATAAVAAAAAGLAISASGQATPSGATGTRTFVASGGSFKNVDVKPKGESPGDYFTLSQKLKENGSSAGSVGAVGTAVTKTVIQFDGTIFLSDGKVMVAGGGKGNSKTTELAIVGGTGAYAGASGTFTTVDHGKTTDFTLTFK